MSMIYADSDLPRPALDAHDLRTLAARADHDDALDEAAADHATDGVPLWLLAVAAVAIVALAALASSVWPEPWFVGWTGGVR